MKFLTDAGGEPKKNVLVLILGVFSLGIIAIYLYASIQVRGIGFPLDDAWIHQTYAKNLVSFGEWAFIPGSISGGSTSPLWTLLLSIGYWVKLPYLWWAFFMGWILLFSVALIGQKLFEHLVGERGRFLWVGLFLVMEWHLGWSAVSGMETLLAAFFVLLFFKILFQPSIPIWMIGPVVGLAIWCRPDLVTLAGPALLFMIIQPTSWKGRLAKMLSFIGAMAVFIGLYLSFNLATQGSIFPGTFYAKQAEYVRMAEIPFVARFFQQLSLPLVGSGVLLLPGALFCAARAVRKRDFRVILLTVWFLGFAGLYAWRLPVTYQHGRYLIPAMPVYFILGMLGIKWLMNCWHKTVTQRIIFRSWVVSTALVLIGFVILGAKSYATDVAIIETEMVQTAKWLEKNTLSTDVIAIHDIGAAGYFAGRPVIDLAGLVSPEVVPFIRDEKRIRAFLDLNNTAYLVTFPGWYPELVRNLQPVYSTDSRFSPAAGGENMRVYRWQVEKR